MKIICEMSSKEINSDWRHDGNAVGTRHKQNNIYRFIWGARLWRLGDMDSIVNE